MAVTAVLFAIITVLAGVVALGDVVMSGAGAGLKRLAVVHVSLAAAGVILLLVAVVSLSRGPAWASFIALLVAGALGLTTLTLTRRTPRGGAEMPEPATVGEPSVPPSRAVPMPVVIAHGVAAVITILAVFFAAAGSSLTRR